MRLLGRVEVVSGQSYSATHVAGIGIYVAEGVLRLGRDRIRNHLAKYTDGSLWNELDTGGKLNELCQMVSSENECNDDTEANLWLLIGGKVWDPHPSPECPSDLPRSEQGTCI